MYSLLLRIYDSRVLKWSLLYGYSAVPLWALLLSVLAFFSNRIYCSFETQIVPLMTVFICMGLTLKPTDFNKV